MRSMGYHQSKGDHTLFIKHLEEKVTTLLVYVDNIVVTGNNEEEQHLLKENLPKEFEIKDLGMLKYFLSIKVAYSKARIFLSQRKYVLDLLAKIGMIGGKGAGTPMDPNTKLKENLSKRQWIRATFKG